MRVTRVAEVTRVTGEGLLVTHVIYVTHVARYRTH
jgi:hypothetical protein